MINMSKDVILSFIGKSTCPSCGCIDNRGSFRCLGCGAFHSSVHLVDRDAPPPEDRVIEDPNIDPLAYSLKPNQKIIEESFEESEDVVQWRGGSTDFTITEEEQNISTSEIVNQKIPKSEEL